MWWSLVKGNDHMDWGHSDNGEEGQSDSKPVFGTESRGLAGGFLLKFQVKMWLVTLKV